MYDGWIALAFSCGLALGLFAGRWSRKVDRHLDYERGFSDGIDHLWPAYIRAIFVARLFAQRGRPSEATGAGDGSQETVH